MSKMLPLPETDPLDPETLAGWVELSVLAVEDGQISLGDVAEELRDSNLLEDVLPEDTDSVDGEPERPAEQLAADVWSVLEERQRLLSSSSPFILEQRLIKRHNRRKRLEDVAAYLTMLLIEAAGKDWYPELEIATSDEIRTQFELVAAASLQGLGNTQVERLGAPYPGVDVKAFRDRVRKLVGIFALSTNEQELERFTHTGEKDRGLDLVVRWWNDDASGGMPYLLVQCATGKKWICDKAPEPPMTAWKKFVTWDGPALKTIAIPYTVERPRGLGDAWLRMNNTIIFDRLRLSRGAPDRRLSQELRGKLVTWCEKKLRFLQARQS
jgi:hypothetical protein